MAPDPSLGPVLGDNLIPMINKLQDIFSQVTVDLKLSLPQVAVVGSQSSGKSSVLEALVGRDFLPRGSDIVTRRPLVLQLVKTSAPVEGSKPAEWGEFLHAPGKQFHDFEKIRQEIQAETDRVVGSNKNVSDKPIRLKIYSPNVLTMTLVDLPGMTKVPVGDQPSNIEQKIREMVLEYIRQPSCIILAVSSANADLANSDALQMAQMVDPDGLRTIGVLTKLDIMDRGTNASHILRNQHIPLRLGYVGVVNRSQEDINKNSPMSQARKAEEAFFTSHPEYRDVAAQCGSSNLARRLNAILVDHISVLLPGLRRRIVDALEVRASELKSLGDPGPLQNKSARGAFLLQLLCEYAERFNALLEGRHADLSTAQLSGGARVRYVFNDMFGRTLRDMQPVRGITDEEICTIIRNGAGVTGNLLVPQEPFELLVRRALLQLLPPSLQCKDLVHEELLRIAEQACPKDASRFPGLQRALASAVLDFIRLGAEPAEAMIRNLVECEHDYINTDHPEFIGGRGAIRAVIQDRSVRAHRTGSGGTGTPAGAAASGGGKDGGEAAPKDGHHGGNLPRNKTAPSISADPASAGGAANAQRSGGNAVGLKGLPEPSIHHGDELLSRTRRRSDDGFSGLSGVNDAIVLSSAPASNGNTQHHQGSTPASTSSLSSTWFSWFGRGDGKGDAAQQQAASSRVSEGPMNRLSLVSGGAGGAGAAHQGGLLRSEQDEVEVEVIRRLVDSYFCIVRKTLLDQVPKAIMHFMVNNTKRGLQQHLIQQLYKEDMLEVLLSERDDVVEQRRTCQEAVNALQQAVKALDEVPGELSGCGMPGGHHHHSSHSPFGSHGLPNGLGGGSALSLTGSGSAGLMGGGLSGGFGSSGVSGARQ